MQRGLHLFLLTTDHDGLDAVTVVMADSLRPSNGNPVTAIVTRRNRGRRGQMASRSKAKASTRGFLRASARAGGPGHLAVQYAKIFGGTVAAVDITDEKLKNGPGVSG
jgi:hypothetical protein